ncbi:hypothetical protein D1J51_14605 [Leucobacter sp. wl10]|nr:hypothetical protein D1J51_14605 [Leucobacter sp. wl10]
MTDESLSRRTLPIFLIVAFHAAERSVGIRGARGRGQFKSPSRTRMIMAQGLGQRYQAGVVFV